MTPFDQEDTPTYDIIERIFEALERADRRGRSSVRDGNRGIDRPFDTEYEFAIDWGSDAVGPPIEDGPASGEADEYLVDSRQEDDGMQVVADLPDVDGDVETRIDEGTRHLEIRDVDGVIERVSLPWSAEIRTKRLNNGVLDVGLVRIGGDDNEQRSDDAEAHR